MAVDKKWRGDNVTLSISFDLVEQRDKRIFGHRGVHVVVGKQPHARFGHGGAHRWLVQRPRLPRPVQQHKRLPAAPPEHVTQRFA